MKTFREVYNDNKDSIKEAFKIGKDFKQRNNITIDDFCEYHNTVYDVAENNEIFIKYSKEMAKIKEELLSENITTKLEKELSKEKYGYDIKIVYINNYSIVKHIGEYISIHFKIYNETKHLGTLIIRYNYIYIHCSKNNIYKNIIDTSLKILNHIFN